MNDFNLTKKVAEILARQFYSGWGYLHPCNMTWEEYRVATLQNWMGAARGLVHLVKEKNSKKPIKRRRKQ